MTDVWRREYPLAPPDQPMEQVMSEPSRTAIYVISSDHSPVHLSVGEIRDTIPVGKNHSLDDRLFPALAGADGIVWRLVGGGGSVPGGNVSATDSLDPRFDAEALLDRNTEDVATRLPGLTSEELLAVRDAEAAGANRKGVLTAINRAIDALNQK